MLLHSLPRGQTDLPSSHDSDLPELASCSKRVGKHAAQAFPRVHSRYASIEERRILVERKKRDSETHSQRQKRTSSVHTTQLAPRRIGEMLGPSDGASASVAVRLGGNEFLGISIQSLLELLREHPDSSSLRPALRSAERTHLLSSLTPERAPAFFDSVVSALGAENHPAARCEVLSRLLAAVAADVPPAVLKTRWSGIIRAVFSSIKALLSGQTELGSSEQPSALADRCAALAALLRAGAAFRALGGSAAQAVASECEAAAAHALRILRFASDVDNTVADLDADTTKVCLAALSIFHSIFESSPAQLRQVRVPLETLLWSDTLLVSAGPDVRKVATRLLAGLPSVHPKKTRTEAAQNVLSTVLRELRSMVTLLAEFHAEGLHAQLKEADAMLDPKHAQYDGEQLRLRFESMLSVLVAFLNSPFPDPVVLPIAHMLSVLMAPLRFVAVDPYKEASARLELASVSRILPHVRSAAADAMVAVVRRVGRGALLPFCVDIGKTVARFVRLSRERDSSVSWRACSGTFERHSSLRAARAIVECCGGAAVGTLAKSVTMSIVEDVKIIREHEAQIASCGEAAESDVTPRPAKRRRRSSAAHGTNREDEQESRRRARESLSTPNGTEGAMDKVLSIDAVRAIKALCVEGLLVARSMMTSRAFLDDKAVAELLKLEALCATLGSRPDSIGVAALGVVSAATLGGGSGRLQAHATPVFLEVLPVLRDLVSSGNLDQTRLDKARSALSACEALIHPRGPPVVPTRPQSAALKESAPKPNTTLLGKRSTLLERDAPSLDQTEPMQTQDSHTEASVRNADTSSSTARDVPMLDGDVSTKGPSAESGESEPLSEKTERHGCDALHNAMETSKNKNTLAELVSTSAKAAEAVDPSAGSDVASTDKLRGEEGKASEEKSISDQASLDTPREDGAGVNRGVPDVGLARQETRAADPETAESETQNGKVPKPKRSEGHDTPRVNAAAEASGAPRSGGKDSPTSTGADPSRKAAGSAKRPVESTRTDEDEDEDILNSLDFTSAPDAEDIADGDEE